MRKTFWLTLAVVAVFVASPATAIDEMSFGQFFNEIQSLDKQARQGYMKSLSDEQRRSLHQQFRDLPEAERAEAAKILLPGRTEGTATKATRAIGTVAYDSGVAHPLNPATGNVIGNMFNTGFGDPHSITFATVQMNGTFGGAAVGVWGAPAGSTAPLIGSAYGTVAVGTFVPISFTTPIVAHSGTFLAGIDESGAYTVPNSTWRAVAVDINDAGFGFHGMSLVGGAPATGFNPSPAVCLAGTFVPTTPTGTASTFSCTGGTGPFNAMVRMTGENLPVELMSLTAE